MIYHLLAILTMTVWGTTFVSTKILLAHGLTPADVFTLRFAPAYLGLCLVSLCCRQTVKGHARPQPAEAVDRTHHRYRDEALMVAAGMTGGSFYFLTENMALELTTAGSVSLLVTLAPLLTALLALIPALNRQAAPRGWRLWCGSLLALGGVWGIVRAGTTTSGSAAQAEAPVAGCLLALAAALLWACYQHLVAPLVSRYGVLTLTRKVFGYGVLTILPFELHRLTPALWHHLADPWVWGNLVYLSLIASLLCYAVWNVVVRRLGPVTSAAYIYLNPIVTCIASHLILGEAFGPSMIFGAAAILLGLYLAGSEGRSRTRHIDS